MLHASSDPNTDATTDANPDLYTHASADAHVDLYTDANTVLYCTVPYYSLQCFALLCYTDAVLYCTIL